MDQEKVGARGSGPPGDSKLSASKRVEEPEEWGPAPDAEKTLEAH